MVRRVGVGIIDNKAGSRAATQGKGAGGGNWRGSGSERISFDGSCREIGVTGSDVDGRAGELTGGKRGSDRHGQRTGDIKLEKVVANEVGVTVHGIDGRGIHSLVVGIGVARRKSSVADTLE